MMWPSLIRINLSNIVKISELDWLQAPSNLAIVKVKIYLGWWIVLTMVRPVAARLRRVLTSV